MNRHKQSPLLKEKLVYIGHLDTYERGSEIADQLMGIHTNDTVIYRLTDEAGLALAEIFGRTTKHLNYSGRRRKISVNSRGRWEYDFHP